MKKSKILRMAIEKEYWLADKNKYGSKYRTFMCLAINDMMIDNFINRNELNAVTSLIESLIGDHATLTLYLKHVKGMEESIARSADIRSMFWIDVIHKLESIGE